MEAIPDRKGTYRPNRDWPVQLADESLNSANTLGDLLFEIDQILLRLGEQLDELQPKKEGRIVVTWEEKKRAARVGRWERRSKTAWRFVFLPRKNLARRVASKGDFAKNYEQVKAVVERVAGLLELRGNILNTYANFTRAAFMLNKHHADRLRSILENEL